MPLKILELTVHTLNGMHSVAFPVSQVIIAGWTGRDEAGVLHHIRELESIGVEPPAATPAFYRVSGDTVTNAALIEVLGPFTSGESEAVLLIGMDETFVAVGSDHTDRQLETVSVSQSKQVCAKPVSADVWPLEEVEAHWDQIRLESWVGSGSGDAYQVGSVAELRKPDDLIEIYKERGGEILPGTVMFCGTVPTIGAIRYNEPLHIKLSDPVLGRKIAHRYELTALPMTL